MKQKTYIQPEVKHREILSSASLMTLSAPDEGIHDGGEGEDDDDPTAKGREDDWGNLW